MAVSKVAFQVRLPEDLHEILKEIATTEHRSLNNLIEKLLTDGVSRLEYTKTKDL